MALAQGSIVALKRTGTDVLNGFFGGRPTFGIITSVAAPWDIVWNDGDLVTGITSTVIDEITFSASFPVGRVARIKEDSGSTPTSSYDSQVIARYDRGAEAFYLLQALSVPNQFFEVPVGDVAFQNDR